jgi:hypothetical protein
MLDLQHSAYGSLTRLQISCNASPSRFFCQRDNCGRREYRQFSASHSLRGQFFCDNQFSVSFDSCSKHCFLQSGAAEAAPCFSVCNCNSELGLRQSCGTFPSVVIYESASLIIYLDHSESDLTSEVDMIYRIKELTPMSCYRLRVVFDDGKTVIYDVKEDIDTIPAFKQLESIHGLFQNVQLDQSRTCVYWNDEVDLPSDTIYEYGKTVEE